MSRPVDWRSWPSASVRSTHRPLRGGAWFAGAVGADRDGASILPNPHFGVRASQSDELWHVDLTIIKLLDGTRVYLHAVIDNYSRRILAWCLSSTFEVRNTVKILQQAAEQTVSAITPPTVVADSGVENINGEVDKLMGLQLFSRVLALKDVTFSNSMIEAWWRSLKHQWLYLNTLDTEATLLRLVAFYVKAHNSEIPNYAFDGQTPDEIYFNTGRDVPAHMQAGKVKAREARLSANRNTSCQQCQPKAAPDLEQRQSPRRSDRSSPYPS